MWRLTFEGKLVAEWDEDEPIPETAIQGTAFSPSLDMPACREQGGKLRWYNSGKYLLEYYTTS